MKKRKKKLWHDPVADGMKDAKIIKKFTKEETKEIEDRINESILEGDRIAKRNAGKAINAAKKAYITF